MDDYNHPNRTPIKVNQLANLLQFTEAARRELGQDHLSTLLDVYNMCCGEVPGLKQALLQLSNALGETPRSEHGDTAAISRLVLELHGIMAGASWPLNPEHDLPNEAVISGDSFEERAGSTEEQDFREIKLKLVLPATTGFEGREYCISLALDEDT